MSKDGDAKCHMHFEDSCPNGIIGQYKDTRYTRYTRQEWHPKGSCCFAHPRAVPNLDPAELTKRAQSGATTLEDPCHLWVQLQDWDGVLGVMRQENCCIQHSDVVLFDCWCLPLVGD